MTNKYPVDVFWSNEDEGYIAIAPDLPGCSAFGETRGEAAAQMEDAIASWLDAAKAAGNPIPNPGIRKTFEDFSGKVLLRMPKELHSDLSDGAQSQGVSLNSYICFLLAQRHYSLQANSTSGNVVTLSSGSISLVNTAVLSISGIRHERYLVRRPSSTETKFVTNTDSPVIEVLAHA